eukprot:540241-Pleurochrysis_carterae.AAC.1
MSSVYTLWHRSEADKNCDRDLPYERPGQKQSCSDCIQLARGCYGLAFVASSVPFPRAIRPRSLTYSYDGIARGGDGDCNGRG